MTAYVTSGELAEWMRIHDQDDDSSLDAAILAASADIDAWCGWAFTVPTAASTRLYRIHDPYVVWLGDPIANTTDLVVRTDDDDDGTAETLWAAADYTLEPLNQIRHGVTGYPWCEIVAAEGCWPCHTRRPALHVTARWGWAATPDTVKTATKMHAAKLHSRRNTRDGVIAFEVGGGMRAGMGLDKDVQQLLHLYRKPGAMVGIA